MDLIPDFVHLNEGHSVFAMFRRIKYYIETLNLNYDDAYAKCYKSSLFTTHTPVIHGNETFEID